MVFVGVDRLQRGRAALSFPAQGVVVLVFDEIAQFFHFGFQSLYAVGLLDFQTGRTGKREGNVQQRTCHDKGLCQIGRAREVIVKAGQQAAMAGEGYSCGKIDYCL